MDGHPRTSRRSSTYATCPFTHHGRQVKGFQGFFLPGSTIFPPKKTPRGKELTPPEKETNRQISSIRIRIEHAIGGVKR